MKINYDHEKYWDERAETYLEGFYFLKNPKRFKNRFIYRPILRYLIRKKIDELKPHSLLEVGCRVGRLFPVYRDTRLSTALILVHGCFRGQNP